MRLAVALTFSLLLLAVPGCGCGEDGRSSEAPGGEGPFAPDTAQTPPQDSALGFPPRAEPGGAQENTDDDPSGESATGDLPPTEPSAVDEGRAAYADAVRAYRAEDNEAFRYFIERAASLRPRQPTYRYALAAAYVLTGDDEAALATLETLADFGAALDPSEDEDFAPIHAAPAFKAVSERLRANARPIAPSTAFATLPDSAFIPEGVAYDPASGSYFMGSVRTGRIVRLRRAEGGGWRRSFFASARAAGYGSALGLAVDTTRGSLWVATSVLLQTVRPDSGEVVLDPEVARPVAADTLLLAQPVRMPTGALGQAALLRFDIQTGAHLETLVPPGAGPHGLGDLAVGPRGRVFATDSETNTIYARNVRPPTPPGRTTAAPRVDTLLVFARHPMFTSLQGLVVAPGGEALWVADYASGLFRVDAETRGVRLVRLPEGTSLTGLDGLAYQPGGAGETGALIGVQNGFTPPRVVRLPLAPSGLEVTAVEVLERAHPRYDEPTLGAVVTAPGGSQAFVYVANSQWNHFAPDGTLRAGRLKRPVLLRLPLD
jgi:DNA-binding beta-propeller fold protein YncE